MSAAAPAPLVRRTTVADWQVLRAVRLRALAEDPDAFGSTHAQALALPEQEYRCRAAAGTTHLALAGDEPVGLVTLVPDGDPAHGELTSMWVDPRHRGTGLARRLVEAACVRGRVDGVRQVVLWVAVGNAAARRLYQRCGFTLTGRRQPVRPEHPERLEEQMRRALSPPGTEARWSTSADQVDDRLRGQLVRCWHDVSNAGGAVGFPVLPVDEAEVREAVAALLAGLRPGRQELLVVIDEADPAELLGWLVLVGDDSTFTGHWARVIRVQTTLAHRGRGVGRALMEEVARRAREDRGLLQLHLELRGGAGLEPFYSGLGWRAIGAWPDALRMGDGDLRDEVLMVLDLARPAAAGPTFPRAVVDPPPVLAGPRAMTFGYDGDGGLGDRLLAAVLRGEKTATSSTAVEYPSGVDPLPRVGERLALNDHAGRVHGVVETTRVTVIPMDEVGDDVARDEGEGFADAAAWRTAHAAFWHEVTDEIRADCGDPAWVLRASEPIVVEWFRLVEPDA